MNIFGESLKQNKDFAQCDRCRKYTRECGYDRNKGLVELLCNRCEEAMGNNFPDHDAYKRFKSERVGLV